MTSDHDPITLFTGRLTHVDDTLSSQHALAWMAARRRRPTFYSNFDWLGLFFGRQQYQPTPLLPKARQEVRYRNVVQVLGPPKYLFIKFSGLAFASYRP
jgi:hypothetical protein